MLNHSLGVVTCAHEMPWRHICRWGVVVEQAIISTYGSLPSDCEPPSAIATLRVTGIVLTRNLAFVAQSVSYAAVVKPFYGLIRDARHGELVRTEAAGLSRCFVEEHAGPAMISWDCLQ